jgi:hypothetical protein
MSSLPRKVSSALVAWSRRVRADASLDAWLHITTLHGYAEEDAAQVGPELVERLIEAVTWVLVMRFLGIVATPEVIEAARSFIADQAYGLPDRERAARYSLRFIGTMQEVEIFIRDLADVDLEDFEARYPFDGVLVRALGRTMDAEEADRIVQAVYEDLTFDGDDWVIHSEILGKELAIWPREQRGDE